MHVDRCDTCVLPHLYASGLRQKASVQAVTVHYLCKQDQGLTLKASEEKAEKKKMIELMIKD